MYVQQHSLMAKISREDEESCCSNFQYFPTDFPALSFKTIPTDASLEFLSSFFSNSRDRQTTDQQTDNQTDRITQGARGTTNTKRREEQNKQRNTKLGYHEFIMPRYLPHAISLGSVVESIVLTMTFQYQLRAILLFLLSSFSHTKLLLSSPARRRSRNQTTVLLYIPVDMFTKHGSVGFLSSLLPNSQVTFSCLFPPPIVVISNLRDFIFFYVFASIFLISLFFLAPLARNPSHIS